MKRFFQPVEKDASFKKLALSSALATGSPSSPSLSCPDGSNSAEGSGGDIIAKGAQEDTPAVAAEAEAEAATTTTTKEPRKFLTWNANSLLLRAKNNWPEFSSLVSSFDPDVICFQEVRMPAAGSKGGTKRPGELKDDTSSSREEKQVLIRALSTGPFREYRAWWSLSDSKYAGTALLIKKHLQPKKVMFSLDKRASKHEQDGRVILAEFDSFFLLNVYSPNNGWKEEENSFQRRRKWDKRVLEFVLTIEKPLIWCGDLNVSHQDIDVSHTDFFSNAKLNGYTPPNKEDCGQPGFTLAERQRFSNILTQIEDVLLCSELEVYLLTIIHEALQIDSATMVFSIINCTAFVSLLLFVQLIPFVTCATKYIDLEEVLFKSLGKVRHAQLWISDGGKLIDAYRLLHKEQDMEHGFSWSGNPIGKYRGKRMRIDYFIVSEKLKDRIVSCDMHGHGIELEGFCGSDHCPVTLELSDET